MDNSISAKFSKLASRLRKSSSQLFSLSSSPDRVTPSSSPSHLKQCLSENNLCLRSNTNDNKCDEDTPDRERLCDPCYLDEHSTSSSPGTPRRSAWKRRNGRGYQYHTLSPQMKKSTSVMDYFLKKSVPSFSLNRNPYNKDLLTMSSRELSSQQSEQVFLFTVEDADCPPDDRPSSPDKQEHSAQSLITMDVHTLQFPQGPVKPNPRRKHSLSKNPVKDKVKPSLPSNSQVAVNLTSETDCSRVESWATEFDNLLGDAAGLQTFTEFLKREFSHENIYFWCKCEKYRLSTDLAEQGALAKEIVERHLDAGALEPVNVDSIARNCAQDLLPMEDEEQVLDKNMFVAAQKQIYNLMKFDSYGRFLKSDLYNACLSADLKGKKLPFPGLDTTETELFTGLQNLSTEGKKPKTRRKSFLPWTQLKSKSKSKEKLISRSTEELDKKEQKKSTLFPSFMEYKISGDRKRNSLSCNDVCAVSEASTTSSLCRVTLPNSSSTMASLVPGQSVRSWMGELLNRRGMEVSDFQVLDVESGVPLDLDRDCVKLNKREVRVKQVSLTESVPVDISGDILANGNIRENDGQVFPEEDAFLSKPCGIDASVFATCYSNSLHSVQKCAKSKEDIKHSSSFTNDGLEEDE